MSKLACLPLVSAMLTGCASIESTPVDQPGDGLVYYMPRKDILVTVVRETAKTTVTVASTAAYADLERPYVLNFKRNWLGKNEIEVGVSSTGLLTSTKSTTTSGVGDALKNLASMLGATKAMAAPPPPVAAACPAGTFTYVYVISDGGKASSSTQPCGLNVTIARIASSKLSADVADAHTPPKPKKQGVAGIFYRQEEAYRVDVVGSANQHPVNVSATLLSPSQGPVRFLPIEKTFFASNKADFAFVDGVPTRYDQNADGEIVGLLKLPADVIGAYFGALGNVFSAFKETNNKESEALVASLKLELAKKKYDACVKAIEAKDDATIQQLECGK